MRRASRSFARACLRADHITAAAVYFLFLPFFFFPRGKLSCTSAFDEDKVSGADLYMGGVGTVGGAVEEALAAFSSSFSSSSPFSSLFSSFSGSFPVRMRYFFLIESQSTTFSILVALLKDN